VSYFSHQLLPFFPIEDMILDKQQMIITLNISWLEDDRNDDILI